MVHGGALAGQGDVMELLNDLVDRLKARASTFEPLQRLSGKLWARTEAASPIKRARVIKAVEGDEPAPDHQSSDGEDPQDYRAFSSNEEDAKESEEEEELDLDIS